MHVQDAYSLVSTPGQLQSDVHPEPRVQLVVVCLQGDACGGGITDDGHQLLATLEGLLLLNIDLRGTPEAVIRRASAETIPIQNMTSLEKASGLHALPLRLQMEFWGCPAESGLTPLICSKCTMHDCQGGLWQGTASRWDALARL